MPTFSEAKLTKQAREYLAKLKEHWEELRQTREYESDEDMVASMFDRIIEIAKKRFTDGLDADQARAWLIDWIGRYSCDAGERALSLAMASQAIDHLAGVKLRIVGQIEAAEQEEELAKERAKQSKVETLLKRAFG